ncbi:MAG: bifunctional riboflavin kinase/FAD synthetase [Nocardioidaceae bacterium]
MFVWRSLADVPADFGPSVVTVGNFDGFHLGHRHVLKCAHDTAIALSTSGYPPPVVAVTFDPHPLAVLAPDKAPAQLTTIDQRARHLAVGGANQVLALPFDKDTAAWSPQTFVRRVLVDALHADAVVVGENFRFGHRAAGDVATLTRLGEEHGFTVEGLALDGDLQPWSSTYVRQMIAEGDVEEAARALGHFYTVEGVVAEGDRRGRALGFPTANVPAGGLTAIPDDGVYAGLLRRLDQPAAGVLPAAVSVGTNPTFDGVERRVESYVLDRTDLELYGVRVEVSFVGRLRGQIRFDGVQPLIEQMRLDVGRARDILGMVRG